MCEHLLVGGAQHLVELLPGPHADDLDGDVDPDLVAGQPDHPLGQVEDADGLAHLQHEDLAAPVGQHRRLEHQLHRLLDAHEEPGHPGVGDRDRAAAGDLAGERGDHAAPAAEHVAEADRAVGGSCGARASTICSARRLDAPMTLEGRTALSVEICTNR